MNEYSITVNNPKEVHEIYASGIIRDPFIALDPEGYMFSCQMLIQDGVHKGWRKTPNNLTFEEWRKENAKGL